MEQKKIIRIGDKFLYADIIKINQYYIRVGTFPGISKYLKQNKIAAPYIVVLPPLTSEAGDNFTGEEFVLWNKLHSQSIHPYFYIGYKNYLKYLFYRLRYTVNQVFNNTKTHVIKQYRIQKVFKPVYVKPESYYFITDDIKIYYGISNIQIYYKNKLFYSWRERCPSISVKNEITKMLRLYKSKKLPYLEDSIVVTPLGTGNGFYGNSSNFIIQYGNRAIWVDPMADPFMALKKVQWHYNKITDYFISHIHEDHIEGLSGVLKLALLKNRNINLITTYKIFKQLNRIYSFLFPDFLNLINHININPNSPLPYHQGYLTVRHNHHVLKCGTLGLKVRYKNNGFALSGDNLYSEELEKRFPKNPAFDSCWFKDCDLIFHEVEFHNKNTVHTHYAELKKLQEKVKGKILAYHSVPEASLWPMVKENRRYVIRNKKVYVK